MIFADPVAVGSSAERDILSIKKRHVPREQKAAQTCSKFDSGYQEPHGPLFHDFLTKRMYKKTWGLLVQLETETGPPFKPVIMTNARMLRNVDDILI